MPTSYTIENSLTEALNSVLANPHYVDLSELRTHDVRIVPLAALRENKDGEIVKSRGKPVSIRKITDIEKALMPDKSAPDFVLIADFGSWEESNDVQREAMLFDALMGIDVTISEAGIKLAKRQPSCVFHMETLRQFGAHDPTSAQVFEIMKSKKTSERLMAPMPEPAKKKSKEVEPETPAIESKPAPEEEVDCGGPDPEEMGEVADLPSRVPRNKS